MTLFRRISLAIATVVAVLLPSTAAHAYSEYVVHPTGPIGMYQTNTWYYSDLASPSLTAGASIGYVWWSYSLSATNPIWAQLCTPDGTTLLCLDLPTGQTSGNTIRSRTWAGLSAQRGWQFRFLVPAPDFLPLNPALHIGGQHEVRVRHG